MDGRRIRGWWLSGCLVVGALGCSNRNTMQPFSSAKPISGVPMASKSNSFWGSLSKPAALEVTAEVDPQAPAKPKRTRFSPTPRSIPP